MGCDRQGLGRFSLPAGLSKSGGAFQTERQKTVAALLACTVGGLASSFLGKAIGLLETRFVSAAVIAGCSSTTFPRAWPVTLV